ncbi:helix-turn-helix domain-containing protein [Kitasatospora indigofera]|uniref:helix-turn-helix domain-containing protein n=1 Tax=Kitasatospora indigofera TaxID=67307 RepID=UPI0033A92296
MSSQDEVEEFAAQLRRLKGRTDRSYAALARRLHMNASTLHRYCTGEAVPLGFAPVERFAAMCGAGPAERTELHRQWVLAVAARQRARTSSGSAPEAAGAHPAGSEAVPADGTAEPAFAAAAGHVPTAAAGPSPDLRDTTEEDRPGPSHEHGATGHPAVRRPWYRHRVAATATVVTVLVATALGVLSALPSGHSPAGGGQESGARAARPAGAPPGSPAPSAPAGTVPAVPPLTWTVNSQLWATGCSHDYVIDKAPRQVPPPPAPQDAAPWARTQGAVHGGQTLVDIAVQGRTEAAVVLEALRVRVVGRAAPVQGTVYSTGQGCGGDLDPRSFAVDLDMDRPIARPVQGAEAGTGSPARQMPYRVSSKDPEVLLVDARAVGCDCLWYLELDWSSQGRTGTERIDDHGLPFRTSGINGLPHYWYAGHDWAPLTG